MTTPRSSNRSASLSAIAALLAAFLMSAGANARAADRSRDYLDADEIAAEFSIADESNMRFGVPTVDVQDGNRVVISADVTLTGADGRQQTSGIIAILIGVVVPPSTGFMDYTDDACLAISDGTSNTIVFGARACAAIGRAWNAYLARRLPALSAEALGFAIDVGTSEAKVSTSDFPVCLIERTAVPPGTSAIDFTDILVSSYRIGAKPGSTACIAGSGE